MDMSIFEKNQNGFVKKSKKSKKREYLDLVFIIWKIVFYTPIYTFLYIITL
jgi:hypothetical protein